MPKVTRRRRIAAPVSDVWSLVSDPHHLPRWWPRTKRVENVRPGDPPPRGAAWTLVLETKRGSGVRADYSCPEATENERLVFEQDIDGTPFERVLHASRIELHLQPEGEQTEVAMTQIQKLRGLSRLGSPMLRRATGRILGEALDGLDEALDGAGSPA